LTVVQPSPGKRYQPCPKNGSNY